MPRLASSFARTLHAVWDMLVAAWSAFAALYAAAILTTSPHRAFRFTASADENHGRRGPCKGGGQDSGHLESIVSSDECKQIAPCCNVSEMKRLDSPAIATGMEGHQDCTESPTAAPPPPPSTPASQATYSHPTNANSDGTSAGECTFQRPSEEQRFASWVYVPTTRAASEPAPPGGASPASPSSLSADQAFPVPPGPSSSTLKTATTTTTAAFAHAPISPAVLLMCTGRESPPPPDEGSSSAHGRGYREHARSVGLLSSQSSTASGRSAPSRIPSGSAKKRENGPTDEYAAAKSVPRPSARQQPLSAAQLAAYVRADGSLAVSDSAAVLLRRLLGTQKEEEPEELLGTVKDKGRDGGLSKRSDREGDTANLQSDRYTYTAAEEDTSYLSLGLSIVIQRMRDFDSALDGRLDRPAAARKHGKMPTTKPHPYAVAQCPLVDPGDDVAHDNNHHDHRRDQRPQGTAPPPPPPRTAARLFSTAVAGVRPHLVSTNAAAPSIRNRDASPLPPPPLHSPPTASVSSPSSTFEGSSSDPGNSTSQSSEFHFYSREWYGGGGASTTADSSAVSLTISGVVAKPSPAANTGELTPSERSLVIDAGGGRPDATHVNLKSNGMIGGVTMKKANPPSKLAQCVVQAEDDADGSSEVEEREEGKGNREEDDDDGNGVWETVEWHPCPLILANRRALAALPHSRCSSISSSSSSSEGQDALREHHHNGRRSRRFYDGLDEQSDELLPLAAVRGPRDTDAAESTTIFSVKKDASAGGGLKLGVGNGAAADSVDLDGASATGAKVDGKELGTVKKGGLNPRPLDHGAAAGLGGARMMQVCDLHSLRSATSYSSGISKVSSSSKGTIGVADRRKKKTRKQKQGGGARARNLKEEEEREERDLLEALRSQDRRIEKEEEEEEDVLHPAVDRPGSSHCNRRSLLLPTFDLDLQLSPSLSLFGSLGLGLESGFGLMRAQPGMMNVNGAVRVGTGVESGVTRVGGKGCGAEAEAGLGAGLAVAGVGQRRVVGMGDGQAFAIMSLGALLVPEDGAGSRRYPTTEERLSPVDALPQLAGGDEKARGEWESDRHHHYYQQPQPVTRIEREGLQQHHAQQELKSEWRLTAAAETVDAGVYLTPDHSTSTPPTRGGDDDAPRNRGPRLSHSNSYWQLHPSATIIQTSLSEPIEDRRVASKAAVECFLPPSLSAPEARYYAFYHDFYSAYAYEHEDGERGEDGQENVEVGVTPGVERLGGAGGGGAGWSNGRGGVVGESKAGTVQIDWKAEFCDPDSAVCGAARADWSNTTPSQPSENKWELNADFVFPMNRARHGGLALATVRPQITSAAATVVQGSVDRTEFEIGKGQRGDSNSFSATAVHRLEEATLFGRRAPRVLRADDVAGDVGDMYTEDLSGKRKSGTWEEGLAVDAWDAGKAGVGAGGGGGGGGGGVVVVVASGTPRPMIVERWPSGLGRDRDRAVSLPDRLSAVYGLETAGEPGPDTVVHDDECEGENSGTMQQQLSGRDRAWWRLNGDPVGSVTGDRCIGLEEFGTRVAQDRDREVGEVGIEAEVKKGMRVESYVSWDASWARVLQDESDSVNEIMDLGNSGWGEGGHIENDDDASYAADCTLVHSNDPPSTRDHVRERIALESSARREEDLYALYAHPDTTVERTRMISRASRMPTFIVLSGPTFSNETSFASVTEHEFGARTQDVESSGGSEQWKARALFESDQLQLQDDRTFEASSEVTARTSATTSEYTSSTTAVESNPTDTGRFTATAATTTTASSTPKRSRYERSGSPASRIPAALEMAASVASMLQMNTESIATDSDIGSFVSCNSGWTSAPSFVAVDDDDRDVRAGKVLREGQRTWFGDGVLRAGESFEERWDRRDTVRAAGDGTAAAFIYKG